METITQEQILEKIKKAKKITFLTGAGVSTPSGIPDYRSLTGVYHGLDQPEYLLSHTALMREPEKFYSFIKNLYHPDAVPNVIHEVMATLERTKDVWVITQNIDQLHSKAGSKHLVTFHGNLYDTYCMKCGQSVDWHEYLDDDHHAGCGGQLRPDVVLYEEGLNADNIETALQAVGQADLVMVVGTTFQVHPFCDLLRPKRGATVIGVNMTPVVHPEIQYFYKGDAQSVFQKIQDDVLK